MDIQFIKEKNNLIVSVNGDIDHHNSEIIRQSIDAMYIKNRAKNILFDFSGVGFMDSSAIGMIIGRYKIAENNGGSAYIACLSESTKRLFELSGLRRIIRSFDTVDEAVKNI